MTTKAPPHRSAVGFQPWLVQAVEDAHKKCFVDYEAFQSECLEVFFQRRNYIRQMLDENNRMDLAEWQAYCEDAFPQSGSSTYQAPTGIVVGGEDNTSEVGAALAEEDPEEDFQESHSRWWSPQRRTPIISQRAIFRQVAQYERQAVLDFLQRQLVQPVQQYTATWQDLQSQLEAQEGQVYGPQLSVMAGQVVQAYHYIVVQLVAVRHILLRYDTVCRTLDGSGVPLLEYFMKHVRRKVQQQISMNQQESPTLLSSYLLFGKLWMHSEWKSVAWQFLSTHQGIHPTLCTAFQTQIRYLQSILQSASSAALPTSVSSAVAQEEEAVTSWWKPLRQWFLLGLLEDNRLELEPAYLMHRGRSLQPEMKQLAEWLKEKKKQQENHLSWILPLADVVQARLQQEEEQREFYQSSNNADDDDSEDGNHYNGQGASSWQWYQLSMALGSAFLYCMNYYIVEPSSTMYVNALGASDAMSGTLIGMMPLASFCAALFFSLWTNHSFRKPVLLSACLLCMGNLLYASAYSFSSMELALVGRFLTGLGGPKCIVRRYMADTTQLSLRTSVNALFGMMVAAGSALGPTVAVGISQMPSFTIWHNVPGSRYIHSNDRPVSLEWNPMTGPGWLMAAFWSMFALLALLTFEEPRRRRGLEEQRKLEAKQQEQDVLYNQEEKGLPSEVEMTSSANYQALTEDEDDEKQPALSSSPTKSFKSPAGEPGPDDDLMTMISGHSSHYNYYKDTEDERQRSSVYPPTIDSLWQEFKGFKRLVTFPVRVCLGLLFVKVFVIEALVSSTSAVTKNRYGWTIKQVGLLGCINGFAVIPLSILIGRMSMFYADRNLLLFLLCVGMVGTSILIDVTDLFHPSDEYYNWGEPLAVGPIRYVSGYFLTYGSIQAFEGVIGSTLSKVIPTALASGTLNSGLLATLVDTFGRACGDIFISLMGFVSLRQLLNLLFIPAATMLLACVLLIRRYWDLLAV